MVAPGRPSTLHSLVLNPFRSPLLPCRAIDVDVLTSARQSGALAVDATMTTASAARKLSDALERQVREHETRASVEAASLARPTVSLGAGATLNGKPAQIYQHVFKAGADLDRARQAAGEHVQSLVEGYSSAYAAAAAAAAAAGGDADRGASGAFVAPPLAGTADMHAAEAHLVEAAAAERAAARARARASGTIPEAVPSYYDDATSPQAVAAAEAAAAAAAGSASLAETGEAVAVDGMATSTATSTAGGRLYKDAAFASFADQHALELARIHTARVAVGSQSTSFGRGPSMATSLPSVVDAAASASLLASSEGSDADADSATEVSDMARAMASVDSADAAGHYPWSKAGNMPWCYDQCAVKTGRPTFEMQQTLKLGWDTMTPAHPIISKPLGAMYADKKPPVAFMRRKQLRCFRCEMYLDGNALSGASTATEATSAANAYAEAIYGTTEAKFKNANHLKLMIDRVVPPSMLKEDLTRVPGGKKQLKQLPNNPVKPAPPPPSQSQVMLALQICVNEQSDQFVGRLAQGMFPFFATYVRCR